VTIGPVGPVGRNQAVGFVGRRCAAIFFTLHIALRFERLIKPQTIAWNISFRRLCGRRGSQLIPERSITTDHNRNSHRASGSRQAGKLPVSNFAANRRAIVGIKPKRQPPIDLETGRRRDLPNEQHLGIPLRTAVAPLSVDLPGRSSPAGWPRMTQPINSVVIGSASPATVSAKRLRMKGKQQNRSPSCAVTVTTHKIACFGNFSKIGVNQKRPFATAHSLWECKLHQIIVGVQHH